MAQLTQAFSAAASVASAANTLSHDAEFALIGTAANQVLHNTSVITHLVCDRPSLAFELNESTLKHACSLPGTILDTADKLLAAVPSAAQTIAAAAAQACAAQMTAVSLRLAVNSAKLAAASSGSSSPSVTGAALSVEQAKELSSASSRAAAATSARIVGLASQLIQRGQQPALSALLAPLLSGYERCLCIHPTVFRRTIPDAMTLAVAAVGLQAAAQGAHGGSATDGGNAVAALAARLASVCLITAYRFLGRDHSAAAGSSSSSSSPSSLSGALLGLMGTMMAPHVTAVQATAAYAPAAIPSHADVCSSLMGLVPPDCVAFARPSDGLTSAVAALDTALSGAGSKAGQGHTQAPLLRRCTSRIAFTADTVRYVLSSPNPAAAFVTSVAAHGAAGAAAHASWSAVDSVGLPLPAIVSLVETLCDAPSTMAAGASSIQAGASHAASVDPVLTPALCATVLQCQAAGLRLLAALITAAPGQMRRYRTAVSRTLFRLLQEAVCVAAADGVAASAGKTAAAAVLGHAPPLALPITARMHAQHGILPLILACWQGYLSSVGLGDVSVPTAQSGGARGWQGEQGGSTCPEAAALLRLTCLVCLAGISQGTGILLVDPVWCHVSSGLMSAMGGQGQAGAMALLVGLLATTVRSASRSMTDEVRLRTEQAALVLSSHWPGPLASMPARPAVSITGPVYSAKLVLSGREDGDVLPPQAKRHKGAKDAQVVFGNVKPEALADDVLESCGLSHGVAVATRQAHGVADVESHSLTGGAGAGAGASSTPATPSGSSTGRHLALQLSSELSSRVCGLLAALVLVPWGLGATSPLTAHMRRALLQLAGHRAGLGSDMDAATAAAVDSALADRAVVASVPAPAVLQSLWASMPSTTAAFTGQDVSMAIGGQGQAGMEEQGAGAGSSGAVHQAMAVEAGAGFGQATGAAAASSVPALAPQALPVPMPVAPVLPVPGQAAVVPLSDSDKARLASYAEALGDDFPDF